MGVELLTDRYAAEIAGTLSCYDRIIIQVLSVIRKRSFLNFCRL